MDSFLFFADNGQPSILGKTGNIDPAAVKDSTD